MQLTGAQIIVQALIDQGVDTVFGYPGGSVLNIYDALYDKRDQLRHILTSHEQGAAHAADGYARSTGKTGVVIATSGPGATNLITGIATAYMDSIPMVAITGNVAMDMLGRDSFQEIDITGITMPITKHNYLVTDAAELAGVIREALVIAHSGRPGPVLIDVPKDITAQLAEYVPQPHYQLRELPQPTVESLKQAAAAIRSSKRPLIYAGGGVVAAGASEELLAFSRRVEAPISCSSMGLSAVPFDYPLYLGMIGMHGTPVSNYASVECDLLIAVGSRFSDRVACNREKFAPGARVIHIDIDASELSKNVTADISVRGDAKTALRQLAEHLEEQHHDGWVRHLLEYRDQYPLPTPASTAKLHPRDVIYAIRDAVGEDAIICTDVGQHQMLTTQYYRFSRPRTFISSCGLGTMGYGMGAALGAQAGNPEKPVVLITGDGSFHMNMNELACAVSEGFPILVVVLNNSVLGMVRQWQKLFYGERYSCTTIDRKTDFVKLAEAFGALGCRITESREILSTLTAAAKAAREHHCPVVVDCITDRDEGVYPIIPPSGTSEDMIYCD